MKRFCITLLLVLSTSGFLHAADYVPGELFIKFRPAAQRKSSGISSADDILANLGASDIRQAFKIPQKAYAGKISAETHDRLDAVASIQRVRFPSNLDMEYVARKLNTHPDIEYAEPVYLSRLCDVPNDPAYQEYLNVINAPQAWDIAHGDTSVVIAIIDSGTDWNHPDLAANLWTNPDETPGNNIDDDGNGYTDDVHGWDFYGSVDSFGNISGDNDPTPTTHVHGTHVTGIAAAVTNNGKGIASLSYNVRYMPLKAGADAGEGWLLLGYDAMLYAVAEGADIINCSWGSPQYSQTGQEVVALAVSTGAMVIASAGNDGNTMEFYPAAFPDVIAVGSVENNGARSSFSNYGPYVDISAPGSMIYSTYLKNSYGYMSGTSMSAPLVSALAALIKSAHSDWDHSQIYAQIVGTSTPVIGFEPYSYLCGCGYIDAEKALGEPALYVEIMNHEFSDNAGNNDRLFESGETIETSITIKNYGSSTGNIQISITSLTGFLTPLEPVVNAGPLEHGEQTTVSDIQFQIINNAPFDAMEYLRLDFESEGTFINFNTIDVVVNPSYATFTANTIEVSFDGRGHIGYIDYPENQNGSGFILRNNSPITTHAFNVPLLFEGGFLIGTDETHISDGLRGTDAGIQESDFVITKSFLFEKAPDGSLQKGSVVFTDDSAGAARLNITVTQEMYEYNESGHDQYIILGYMIKNDGDETLSGLRAGLFLDYDIPILNFQGNNDTAFYSSGDDLLVMAEDDTEDVDKLLIGATTVDSIYTPKIINNAGEDGSFSIYDGFSNEEKWQSLSAGKSDLTQKAPGDLSLMLSPDSFTLEPGGQKHVVFIIAYGIGYEDLLAQITNARTRAADIILNVDDTKQSGRPGQFSIRSIYPNPFNPATTICVYIPESETITIGMYDILGRKVKTVFHGFTSAGEHNFILDGTGLASGLYFIRLHTAGGFSAFQKITVLK